jgi:hypothetical protein
MFVGVFSRGSITQSGDPDLAVITDRAGMERQERVSRLFAGTVAAAAAWTSISSSWLSNTALTAR